MVELIEYMAKALVDNPDEVSAKCIDEDSNSYELFVSADDRGKVIGRKGRTANALRTILAAASDGDSETAHLEIVD